METWNLSPGDELVIGPVTATTKVKYEMKSSGDDHVAVRDAIEHRDQQIERLRAHVAELEAERGASADEVADAVIQRVREAFGGR